MAWLHLHSHVRRITQPCFFAPHVSRKSLSLKFCGEANCHLFCYISVIFSGEMGDKGQFACEKVSFCFIAGDKYKIIK